MLLLLLVICSLVAIVMGEALDFPLVRKEGKRVKNVTSDLDVIDVLGNMNDTDDVLYRDEYFGDGDDFVADEVIPVAKPISIVSEVNPNDNQSVRRSNAEGSNDFTTVLNQNAGILDGITNAVDAVVNATIAKISTNLLQNTTTENMDLQVPIQPLEAKKSGHSLANSYYGSRRESDKVSSISKGSHRSIR